MVLALEWMKQAGPVTERGKARTDSTYVLAAGRECTASILLNLAVVTCETCGVRATGAERWRTEGGNGGYVARRDPVCG